MKQPKPLFATLVVAISFSLSSIAKAKDSSSCPWSSQWESRSEIFNAGEQLRTDSLGNVYTVGTDWPSHGRARMAVLKWDPQGNLLWKRRFRTKGGSLAIGKALVLDGKRNVVAVGTTSSKPQGTTEVTVASWTESGKLRWNASFAKEFFEMQPQDVAMDRKGNAYVTGYYQRSAGHGTYRRIYLFVIKVSRTGNVIWSRKGPSPEMRDFASTIKVDSDGNAYVGGCTSNDEHELCQNSLVAKYDTRGILQWISTGNNMVRAHSLSIDNRGNVVIFDSSMFKSTDAFVLAKLNSTDGSQMWSTEVSGIVRQDNFVPMTMRGNHIYFSGRTEKGHLATMQYRVKDGKLKWRRTWSGGTKSIAKDAAAVAVSSNNHVHVLGTEQDDKNPHRAYILVYNKHGKLLYQDSYSYEYTYAKDRTYLNPALALSCDGGFFFSAIDACSARDCGPNKIVMVKYGACESNKNVEGECAREYE